MPSSPTLQPPTHRRFRFYGAWLGAALVLSVAGCASSNTEEADGGGTSPNLDALAPDAGTPDLAPEAAPSPMPAPHLAALGVRSATQTCQPTLPFPVTLSLTGCYTDIAKRIHSADLVPFEVVSPLWTDGAHKSRYLAVPPGKTVTFDENGAPLFPEGTVFLKEFVIQLNDADPTSLRPMETRLMRKSEFGWDFASYEWALDGSDATFVPKGHVVPVELKNTDGAARTLGYLFPGNADCLTCHTPLLPQYFGPAPAQLFMDVSYDGVRRNQQEALADVGLFSRENMRTPAFKLVNPKDESQPLEARARSWLHANCSHCHQPGGWVPPLLTMDLRYDRELPLANTCNVRTQYLTSIPRIKPGDPAGSAIWRRISSVGFDRMPPIGVSVTDPAADVVRQWIASLTTCPPKPELP